MLSVRDNIIVIPTIQVGAVIGNVDGLAMSGAAGSFTEAIDVGTFTEAMIIIKTASKTGTSPTLDCKAQTGFKDSNNQWVWSDLGDAITQMTDNGISIKRLTANFGKYIRLLLTIGGTNTPGYTVTARVALKG